MTIEKLRGGHRESLNFWILLFCWWFISNAHAWSPATVAVVSTSRIQLAKRPSLQPLQRSAASSSSSNEVDFDLSNNRRQNDVFVVSWDGCLVDNTCERNREWGLAAAYQVWPELEVMTVGADLTWLNNKLEALQHVLSPTDDDAQYHPAVEYGLAIRMLLEEQELDLGESNGSKGKYGSRFHPSQDCEAFPKRSGTEIRSRSRRQRPLTVGEISANWKETLREACWIRYFQEEKENPLDMLHNALVKQIIPTTINNQLSSAVSPDLASILQHSSAETSSMLIVGVYHGTELAEAKASLIAAGLDPVICQGAREAVDVTTNNQRRPAIICLERNTVKNILQAAPEHSTIHVLESYYSKLQRLLPLFGDFIPRAGGDGVGKCSVENRQLRLCLCEWAKPCHPNDAASATMNVWMCKWDKLDFLKCMVGPRDNNQVLQ